MAFLKLLIRTLLILLILFAVIGLLLPSSAQVERSLDIRATPAQLFSQINDLRAFHTWSPWAGRNPQAEYSFSGPERGVGARMRWHTPDQPNSDGSMEIINSIPDREVQARLGFSRQGFARLTFVLDPQGADNTRITWRFQSEFGWNLFARYVGLMLDQAIGRSFDQGLHTLQQHVEQNQPSDDQGTAAPAGQETPAATATQSLTTHPAGL